jgi:hypothetical protein
MGYVPEIPRDTGGVPLQEFAAAKLPKARYATDNASASSVITLTDDTTMVEVFAGTVPGVIKWITTSDVAASVIAQGATADWHHVIPAGQVRRFAVPTETNYASGQGSAVGVRYELGLYGRVARKTTGVGSVYLVEY